MADAMGVGLNDNITLVLPEATPSPAGVVPVLNALKWSGSSALVQKLIR